MKLWQQRDQEERGSMSAFHPFRTSAGMSAFHPLRTFNFGRTVAVATKRDEERMLLMLLSLLAEMIHTGPVSNGTGLGSCLARAGPPVDLRGVMLLQNRELTLDSVAGRFRISVQGQRFRLDVLDSSDGRHIVGNVGDTVSGADDRLDVFVTLGMRDGEPILYWRETYQHRSFRQGLLRVDLGAVNADWARVLKPLCEGVGGVTVTH